MQKDDVIYRQDAVDAVNDYLRLSQMSRTIQDMTSIQEILEKLPSAEPKLDEWCYDCKEYDKEKHSCPRWNRVIRNTLKDAQLERPKGEWIELGNSSHNYICSLCGRMLVGVTDGKNNVAKSYPFCHRGANMRASEKE